ncbi:BamA/TamA family outer membrane protein [Flavisolibacter nicotianae]|uniref:BamA/TamA family outer membrane protein n=1 Tax=Flavisolibacter nicotianae TaxID=2364882 RepID=UPI000EB3F0CC|nr:BamA/TamA family outer membrane protein [Flavisolibacter nicotianae]
MIQRKTFLPFFSFLFFLLLLCTGCFTVTVKNYPQRTPFVFQTNVHVKGDFGADERKELEAQLSQQLDDSIRVRAVSKAIGWDNGPKFFYEVQNRPTPFDSLSASQTVGFMHTLLNTLGYFRDSINFTTKIKSRNDSNQLRTYIDFYVYPGAVTRLDSIAYRLNNDTAGLSVLQQQNLDTLQKVTDEVKSTATIKKGDPFARYKLATERDRLADVYRNNGYLRFSEEELLIVWDTVGIELLRPTVDPIEQAALLQRLAERRAHPVADVEFRLRANPDSTRITRYHVGRVTVYPEYNTDTVRNFRFTDTVDGFVIRYNDRLFKSRIFPDYIFLNPGALYRQSDYLKTQNKFNALSAWRVVAIDQQPRAGQDTADFSIRLTPARKYAFNTNFEVSRNQGNISIAQGNLIGLGLTLGVQNRNFLHGANLAITNFRFGTELNATFRDLIQTRQITLSNTVQIPRLVPSFMRRFNKAKENTVTSVFALNGGLTQRRDYFDLTTLNTSWGYQFGWRNKLLGIRFPNIEYNYLIRLDSLEELIRKNASYKYIFNTGLIISTLWNYSIAGGKGNVTNLTSVSAELSGLPGLFKTKIFGTNLYRFFKVDAEFRQTHKLFRNAFAWRVFAGAGYSMPSSSDDSINRFLPFFREYFAGGPNSMRAWSVRKLGPGSAIRPFGRTDAPDRFGDIRLEANAEYRIFLTNYKGIGINTALFTDVGNVWFLRKNDDFPDGEFPNSFAKLWKDLAIGAGTGLRIDFGFLKVRVDYAYKVKNPTPELAAAQNKWFYGWQLLNGQVQLGIDYPF